MTLIKKVLLPLRSKCITNPKRYFSNKDIRNIGILAHIDAGKVCLYNCKKNEIEM